MAGTTEFGLIEKYFSKGVKRDDVVVGIGDDCALLAPPNDKQLVVTVDTLVAGVHFPEATSAEDIAYKSLAVNLSDLASIGAEPAWATLALTLPGIDETWLQQFAASLHATLAAYNVQLIGGDTTQGPLTITLQLTGFVTAKKVLRRDAAQPGDRIYVTGHLGDAALGLKLLMTGAPESVIKTACLEKLNRPVPRIEFAQQAVDYCRCAIDISDGLTADLGHILKASQCGATIYYEQLPVSSAFTSAQSDFSQLDFSAMLLSGGDDYELCLTCPTENEAALLSIAQSLGLALTHIGEIEADAGLRVINASGESIELKQAGYEHFAND